jgi:hypothetical protein
VDVAEMSREELFRIWSRLDREGRVSTFDRGHAYWEYWRRSAQEASDVDEERLHASQALVPDIYPEVVALLAKNPNGLSAGFLRRFVAEAPDSWSWAVQHALARLFLRDCSDSSCCYDEACSALLHRGLCWAVVEFLRQCELESRGGLVAEARRRGIFTRAQMRQIESLV